jgi:Protein of unknown function (DUF2970)
VYGLINIALKAGWLYHFLLVIKEINVAKPSIIQTIMSILSAFMGVQSNKNRLRDFKQGSLTTYIIAGLIFTVVFVSALVFVVSLVIG